MRFVSTAFVMITMALMLLALMLLEPAFHMTFVANQNYGAAEGGDVPDRCQTAQPGARAGGKRVSFGREAGAMKLAGSERNMAAT